LAEVVGKDEEDLEFIECFVTVAADDGLLNVF
jgi:hypothetical protein